MSSRRSSREGGGVPQRISTMSCYSFIKKYNEFSLNNNVAQCSHCDIYSVDSPSWSKNKTKKYETMHLPRRYLCLRLQIVNPAWVPFSESEMFENISEFRGSGFQETVAGSRESPALSSSIVIHSPTRPSSSYNIDIGVGGDSGGLEERMINSSRRIIRERSRLLRAATESAEKVTGLKRKVEVGRVDR